MVGFVDENQVRNAVAIKKFQGRCGDHGACRIGFDYDDCNVAYHRGFAGILCKVDRAGAVDEVPFLVKITGLGNCHFGAHVPFACFSGCITDCRAIANGSLAVDTAGCSKEAFKKAGLAAGIGADQCCASRNVPGA